MWLSYNSQRNPIEEDCFSPAVPLVPWCPSKAACEVGASLSSWLGKGDPGSPWVESASQLLSEGRQETLCACLCFGPLLRDALSPPKLLHGSRLHQLGACPRTEGLFPPGAPGM